MRKIILDNLGELDWINWKALRLKDSLKQKEFWQQLRPFLRSLSSLPFLVAALLISGVPSYELNCGGGGLVA